jgi:hypothetical protein
LPNCCVHERLHRVSKMPQSENAGKVPVNEPSKTPAKTCGRGGPRAEEYGFSALCPRGMRGNFRDRRQDAVSPGGVSVISIRSASPHSRSSE